MPSADHPEPAAASLTLTARWLESDEELRAARAWLDTAEAQVGVPLVDEAERYRLDRGELTSPGWAPLVIEHLTDVVGYGALLLPGSPRGQNAATGDLAVASDHAEVAAAAIRSTGLRALREHAHERGAGELQVWMRHVTDTQLDGVNEDGFEVARRLAVLGRDLTDDIAVPEVADVEVRPSQPERDDVAIVEVLALAYEGTGDGGWTPERFAERRALPWFRPEDLLLAEAAGDASDAGSILGLHWLKRRGGGVGEVYNLAIHPDGQGRGVGGLLLTAGLAHLRSIGCHEVLLWVDRANERAVELYTSRGFVTRWDDVALDATTAPAS